MFKISMLILLIPLVIAAQQESEKTEWDILAFFEGVWIGEGKGKYGSSSLEREYRYILGGKYLYAVNRSEFEPTEKNPAGEIHENIDYYSFDKIRKKVILRQFHNEGFVNEYVIDSLSTDNRTIIFATENIENLPEGWRARITILILNEDEFLESFDLAAPDKEFGCLIENRFHRKK